MPTLKQDQMYARLRLSSEFSADEVAVWDSTLNGHLTTIDAHWPATSSTPCSPASTPRRNAYTTRPSARRNTTPRKELDHARDCQGAD